MRSNLGGAKCFDFLMRAPVVLVRRAQHPRQLAAAGERLLPGKHFYKPNFRFWPGGD